MISKLEYEQKNFRFLIIVGIWTMKFRLRINFWFWKTILLKNRNFVLKRSKTKFFKKNKKYYIFEISIRNNLEHSFSLSSSLVSLSSSLSLFPFSLLLSFPSFPPPASFGERHGTKAQGLSRSAHAWPRPAGRRQPRPDPANPG